MQIFENLSSPTKAKSRETAQLYFLALHVHQFKSAIAIRTGVRSKSEEVKPRRQRGTVVVIGDDVGRVVERE